MKWKLARLAVVIGAFLMVVDFFGSRSAVAQSQNCTCSGHTITSRIPLTNPTCGYHPFYIQTHEYGPYSCQAWCENLIVYTIAPNSCTLDAGACGDGGDPITVAWYASVEYVDEYGSYQQPINDFQGCN